jgi:hypothetical protein
MSVYICKLLLVRKTVREFCTSGFPAIYFNSLYGSGNCTTCFNVTHRFCGVCYALRRNGGFSIKTTGLCNEYGVFLLVRSKF